MNDLPYCMNFIYYDNGMPNCRTEACFKYGTVFY